MSNGLAKSTFQLVDLSYRFSVASLGRACALVNTRRGPNGKYIFCGNTADFDAHFGKLPDDLDLVGALAIRRALDRGAQFYIARASHYTDPTDPSTIDGSEAYEVLADRGATYATVTINQGGVGGNDMIFTARMPGADGNGISVHLVEDGAGNNVAVSVVANSLDPLDVDITITYGAATVWGDLIGATAAINNAISAYATLEFSGGGGGGMDFDLDGTSADFAGGGNGADTLEIRAIGVGDWPNAGKDDLKFATADSSQADDRFDLTLSLASQPDLAESYAALSMDPTSDRYAPAFVNTRSKLVRLADKEPGTGNYALRRPVNVPNARNLAHAGVAPVTAKPAVLDYKGDAAAKTGIHLFDDVDDASRLLLADSVDYLADDDYEVHAYCVDYCANREDMLYLCQVPDLAGQDAVDWRKRTGDYAGIAIDSRFVEFIYDRMNIRDPRNGAEIYITTTADAAEIKQRAERLGKPWTAAAGSDFPIGGVINLARNVGLPARQAEGDLIADAQINPFVAFRGQPVCLWGNRTGQRLESAASWVHVNDLVIVLRRTLLQVSRLDLFKPHNWRTWRQAYLRLKPFMDDLAAGDAFIGGEGVGYVIRCDQDARLPEDAVLNTPTVRETGTFLIDVYMKPSPTINWVKVRGILSPLSAAFEELFDVTPAA